MGRYANTKIRLDFPDLSEDDDPIYVTIRNPKTVPASMLEPASDAVGPDGQIDKEKATESSYSVMSGLIVDWHVYDAADEESDALPLPATPESMRKLPMDIVNRLMSEVTKVFTPPQ